MAFLIKIDQKCPTFAWVEGLKLCFYEPLSTLLMEKSFYLFCECVLMVLAFSFFLINFYPP